VFWCVLVGSGGFWWVLVGSGEFWFLVVAGEDWCVLVGSGGFSKPEIFPGKVAGVFLMHSGAF
jgi:hypothetical protein